MPNQKIPTSEAVPKSPDVLAPINMNPIPMDSTKLSSENYEEPPDKLQDIDFMDPSNENQNVN